MAKTIKEEIVDYLNEKDMYFVEEYDKDGFPINDEADDLVFGMTNCELCELVTDAMNYIAEVQRERYLEKSCKWLNEHSMVDSEIFRKAMEEE